MAQIHRPMAWDQKKAERVEPKNLKEMKSAEKEKEDKGQEQKEWSAIVRPTGDKNRMIKSKQSVVESAGQP
jgi:hypothetical protein